MSLSKLEIISNEFCHHFIGGCLASLSSVQKVFAHPIFTLVKKIPLVNLKTVDYNETKEVLGLLWP